MQLICQELMELKSFREKQEQANNHVLAEIKSTNDAINNNVLVTMEKTNNNILEIRKEVVEMKNLTSQVQLIINMMNINIQKEENILRNSSDDMIIDKDVNKRNLYGTLRDSDGNLQQCDHNKENYTTGGNQNKCTHNDIDYVGTSNP
jgi:ribosomal protein S25